MWGRSIEIPRFSRSCWRERGWVEAGRPKNFQPHITLPLWREDILLSSKELNLISSGNPCAALRHGVTVHTSNDAGLLFQGMSLERQTPVKMAFNSHESSRTLPTPSFTSLNSTGDIVTYGTCFTSSMDSAS